METHLTKQHADNDFHQKIDILINKVDVDAMRTIEFLEPRKTKLMYHFAQFIYDMTNDTTEMPEDIFPDFLYLDEESEIIEKIRKPSKTTLLHNFIINNIEFSHDYIIHKAAELECDYFSKLILDAGLNVPSWLNEKNISQHRDELTKICRDATSIVTPTVFNHLFSDRNFLNLFQLRLSRIVKNLSVQEHPKILKKDGVIKRPSNLPQWLKKAVYFRDQGRCQICFCDLSGLSSARAPIQLDHMIPLAAGGTNDPTNFQVICAQCNASKGAKPTTTPARFAPYW